MGRLREHDFEDWRCAECQKNEPVGPCGSCESMVCGDCCVLTTDPGGKRAICSSCARLIASVNAKRVERRPVGAKVVAAVILLAFAVTAVALLGR